MTGIGAVSRVVANLGEWPLLTGLLRTHGWHAARVRDVVQMRVPGDITAGVDGRDRPAAWTERFDCKAPGWQSKGAAEQLTNETLRFESDAHCDLGFGAALDVVGADGDGAEQADLKAAGQAIELALPAWKEETAVLYDVGRDRRQFAHLADDPDQAGLRAELEVRLRWRVTAIGGC